MKKIQGLLEKYPLFLLTIPLFIVLHIEKEYGHLINYEFVTTEILILFIAPFIVYFISRLLLKPALKSNLLSFIILFFFFFSGEIKDWLKENWPGSMIQSYSLLLPTIFIIILFFYIIIRKKTVGKKVTLFINTATLLFVIIDSLSLIFITEENNPRASEKKIFAPFCKECEKPDIYYIIFDSYTSSKLLKAEFGYDNSAIENFLKETGFRVIEDSRSNYNITPFSISSVFNMSYLDYTDTVNILHLKGYLPAVDKVYYTSLFPAMEKQGYSIYNHSTFNFKGHKTSVPAFDMWKINKIYQQFNIIKKTHNEIGWNFPSWMNITLSKQKNYINTRDQHDSIALKHLFETISDTSSQPKLVYTHFFLPHSPYSFDSSGRIVPSYNLSLEEDKQAYLQQIMYVNKIMKQIVEAIKISSGGKAVIIIQGDHGYRFFDPSKKQPEFPNFNAIYFPNKDYRQLYDSMTNVNTFRAVFNTFFHQNFSMLPAETYFLKYK